MKKILFLLLICLIKLNAYQYLIYENPTDDVGVYKFEYLQDYPSNYGHIVIKMIRHNGNSSYAYNIYSFFGCFNSLKNGYISDGWKKNDFITYYKNDLNLLNDIFTYEYSLMPFLNYLYNPNSFSSNNYIKYKYELLYNENGLAVESIVNGIWAGLYSESEKRSSGYLYDSGGTLIYYNGEKVSWIQSAIDKIMHYVIDNLYKLVHIISTTVGVCVSVVFALCLVYYVVEVGRRAIKPIDDNKRKRNLNE